MTWLGKIPTYLSVPTTLDLLLALACWSKCSMSSNALLVDPSSSPSEDDGFPAVAKPGRYWKELRKIQTKKKQLVYGTPWKSHNLELQKWRSSNFQMIFPFQLADFLVNQPLIFQGVRYLHHENASGVINNQRWFKKKWTLFWIVF